MESPLFLYAVLAMPAVAIAVVGIAVALWRWTRHPRASLLVLLGLACVVASRVGGVILQTWMLRAPLSGLSYADIGTRIAIWNYVLTGLAGIAIGLITVAVFVDRPSRVDA